MKVSSLDHYNIETVKPEETVRFYCEVLGLRNAPERRPPADIPGTWILIGDRPAIHVNFVGAEPAGTTGPIDHVALEAGDHRAFEASFRKHGIAYEKVERLEINLCQLYVSDPNGIKIELNIRDEL